MGNIASAQAATAKAIAIGIIIELSMIITRSIHNFPKKPEYLQKCLFSPQLSFILIRKSPVIKQAIMIVITIMIGSKKI
jgi:hypothetical protein